ncbi:MAG: T9SS type A sorting domain-containing protein, partial [Cryomorphaceae bacterium]
TNETDELFPNLSGFNEPDYSSEEFSVSSQSVTLYPNPATQEISIDIQSANPISGFITNNLGVIIKNLSFEDGLNSINVSDMSSGNYILRVLGDDDKIYVEQFVVH